MKSSLILPSLTLVAGIGIGVALDRGVISSAGGRAGASGGQSSAVPIGPRATEGTPGDRGGSATANRSHFSRNPVATVRRVSQQLEISPMINMDFETLLEAYESIRWMEPEDIRIALAELDEKKGMNQGTMMLRFMLMGLWAKVDGKGAMEYATALKQPMDRMMSVMSSITGWMKHDPANAYQWYRDNRDELKGGMMGAMQMDGMFIASLASQDMGMAFHELGELSGQNQSMALAMMANTAAMDGNKRKQFLERLERLEDETLKQNGMNTMMGTWAMTDPQGAIGYLEDMDPKPDNYKALMDSAASSWGMMDPESAIQWQLKNLGEDEVASSKISGSFGRWVATDPKAAEEWLVKQPEGLATDELYQSAVSNSVWMDPEGSTLWAVKIQDETKRRDALATIQRTMTAQGEKALSKWMDGLEPSIRKEVEAIGEGKDGPDGQEPAEVIE